MNQRSLRAPVLDVEVTPLRAGELLDELARAVSEGSRRMILAHNLHSVHLLHTDPAFHRRYRQADITLVDGMPVLAMLSLGEMIAGRRPFGPAFRLGSADWIGECARLSCVERIVVLGAGEVSNREAVDALRRYAPGTAILGVPADPWHEEDMAHVAQLIAGFAPQVLLIGMGMRLQERIAEELGNRTAVPVIAAVGGAVDQISGRQSLAPRWLGRMGFEWLWRLASDPRRLAGRYLIEPVRLAGVLLRRAI